MAIPLLSLLFSICLFAASIVGVFLNVYVLRRLRRFAHLEPNRFEYGCGLPLMVMAIADLIALVVFLLNMFSTFLLRLLADYFVLQSCFCKLQLYLTHVTTNVSMWCWVLMSAMRYIAVYHPFLHLRVWVLPRRGVQLIVLMSLLLNVSFIGVIEANSKTMKCKETPLFDTTHDLTWWLHLAELSWGFFMPALITLLMDWRVLMINPSTAIVRHHGHYNLTATRSLDDSTARSELNFYTNEMPRASKPRSTVLKWLAITLVDLLLNAPDNILRLAIMFADPNAPVWKWYMPARVIAQICYFGQYGFNAIYLSVVVYNRSYLDMNFQLKYCPFEQQKLSSDSNSDVSSTNSKPTSGAATAMHSVMPQSVVAYQPPRQRSEDSNLPDLITSTPTVTLLADDC